MMTSAHFKMAGNRLKKMDQPDTSRLWREGKNVYYIMLTRLNLDQAGRRDVEVKECGGQTKGQTKEKSSTSLPRESRKKVCRMIMWI